MSTKSRSPNGAVAAAPTQRDDPRPDDTRLNEQLTALLRSAAEDRDERTRTRTVEDDVAGRHATDAIYDLVRRGPDGGGR